MRIWAEPPDTEDWFEAGRSAVREWAARERRTEPEVVDPDVDPETKDLRRIRLRGLPMEASREMGEELKGMFAGVKEEVDWIACWDGETDVQFFKHSKAREMLGELVGKGVKIGEAEVSMEMVEAGVPVVLGLVTYRYLQESWFVG